MTPKMLQSAIDTVWHMFATEPDSFELIMDVDGTQTSSAYRTARLIRHTGLHSLTSTIHTTPDTITLITSDDDVVVFRQTDESLRVVNSGDFLDFFEITAQQLRDSHRCDCQVPDLDISLWSRQVASVSWTHDLSDITLTKAFYTLAMFIWRYRTPQFNQHNQYHVVLDGGLVINNPRVPVIYLDAITDEVIDGDEAYRGREAFDLYKELVTHGAIPDRLPVVARFIQEYGDEETTQRLAYFQQEQDDLIEHLGYADQANEHIIVVNQGIVEHAPKGIVVVDLDELEFLPTSEQATKNYLQAVYRTYERIITMVPQLLRDLPQRGAEYRTAIRQHGDDMTMKALVERIAYTHDPVAVFADDDARYNAGPTSQ